MPLTAKYATTCAACGGGIRPGEPIARSGSGWGHAACPASGATADPATPDPATPDPATPDPATPDPATPDPATPDPATPDPARPDPATPDPARPDTATTPAAGGGLEVWTDGACSGNPGPGGWAWATKDGQQGAGGEPVTTNQRMEIAAALAAVRALPGPLVVVSDSTYVVNCFRDGWWRGWLARGWTTSARKPVVSRDLWEPLITLVNERADVSFRWVKGHSGDRMNDLVDVLAVEEAKRQAGR